MVASIVRYTKLVSQATVATKSASFSASTSSTPRAEHGPGGVDVLGHWSALRSVVGVGSNIPVSVRLRWI